LKHGFFYFSLGFGREDYQATGATGYLDKTDGTLERRFNLGKDHNSALGTLVERLVERTTRNTLLNPLKDKDAVSVRQAFARRIKTLPKQMKLSITLPMTGVVRWRNINYLRRRQK